MNLKAILLVFLCMASFQILAGTGFLKGEQVSGINKICYYDGPSGSFSITVSAARFCPVNADDGRGVVPQPGYGRNSTINQRSSSVGATGFLKGQRSSGRNKICYYQGPRGMFTKTVGAAQVCPVNATQ